MRFFLTIYGLHLVACTSPSPTATAGDGAGPCDSGEIPLEAAVVDWGTGQPPTVTTSLTQVDSPAAAVSAAPNGRVRLCLRPAETVELLVQAEGYLALRLVATETTLRAMHSDASPLPIVLATRASLTSVAQSVDVTLAPGGVPVWMDLRRYPGATGIIGAAVSLPSPATGPFVQDDTNRFIDAAETTDTGVLLFLNANASAGFAQPTIDRPSSCEPAPRLPLESGTLTSWLAKC